MLDGALASRRSGELRRNPSERRARYTVIHGGREGARRYAATAGRSAAVAVARADGASSGSSQRAASGCTTPMVLAHVTVTCARPSVALDANENASAPPSTPTRSPHRSASAQASAKPCRVRECRSSRRRCSRRSSRRLRSSSSDARSAAAMRSISRSRPALPPGKESGTARPIARVRFLGAVIALALALALA